MTEKLFEIRKYVRAKSITDALRKEKTIPADAITAVEHTAPTGFTLD